LTPRGDGELLEPHLPAWDPPRPAQVNRTPMRDYRNMTPCERIRYYRARLREIERDESRRGDVLAKTFHRLIQENLRECEDEL
jgi:hypothetical protein